MGAWGLVVLAKSKLKNKIPEQKKEPLLKLESWNVRTMTTGMDTAVH